jgi:hypothetical protein
MSESRGHLTLSVVWSYLFAVLLLLFIFLFLVPDADGPSPWDGPAFRAGMLEMLANFRLLDDMADLGVVRVADVGEGWLDAELDLVVVSDRRFGWTPFYIALVFGCLALVVRAMRHRLLAAGPGVTAEGLMSSYVFGRGLNLFFPFGPGELGAARALAGAGLPPDRAARVVFDNRLFEVLAIVVVLAAGLAWLGWDDGVLPACWAAALLFAVVSLTRPLGRASPPPDLATSPPPNLATSMASPPRHIASSPNPLTHLWWSFNGPALVAATRRLCRTPAAMIGLLTVSVIALGLETLAYWCMKQAFSSPMDDYVLMKDLAFVPFVVVIAVANMARVLPYTFASLGIYEIVSVAMFRVFDQGFLGGTTVTLLDSMLINGLSLAGFLIVLWLGRSPSAIETWRAFLAESAAVSDAIAAPAAPAASGVAPGAS